MNNNRNPFEIRTELLELAQNYLEQQWKINHEFAKKAFDEMLKTNQATPEDWQKFVPQPYAWDELITKAKELYSFVNETR